MVAVGEHPGEDVEAAGRALRVGLGADVVGQRQLLQQRHQVGAVALQHGAVAQVDLLERQPLDLLLDRRVDVGQEAAAQRPGVVAEAQVDAGGLDRLGQDPVLARAQPAGLDRPAQGLRGEDALGAVRPRLARRAPPPLRSPRSSSRDYATCLGDAEVRGERKFGKFGEERLERGPSPARTRRLTIEAIPPTTASSMAGAARPRPGGRRAVAQVGDEALDREAEAGADVAGRRKAPRPAAGWPRPAPPTARRAPPPDRRRRPGPSPRARRRRPAPPPAGARRPRHRRRGSSRPCSRTGCRSRSWRSSPRRRRRRPWCRRTLAVEHDSDRGEQAGALVFGDVLAGKAVPAAR